MANARDDMSTAGIAGNGESSLHKGQSYFTVVHNVKTKRLRFATVGLAVGTFARHCALYVGHGRTSDDPTQACRPPCTQAS